MPLGFLTAGLPRRHLMPAKRQAKLGQILKREGVVEEGALNTALALQKGDSDERIGSLCAELRLAEERSILRCLAWQLGVPGVDLKRSALRVEALRRLPRKVAERLHVLPLRQEPGRLLLAMRDPHDIAALDEVRFVTGLTPLAHAALGGRLRRSIRDAYDALESGEGWFYGPEADRIGSPGPVIVQAGAGPEAGLPDITEMAQGVAELTRAGGEGVSQADLEAAVAELTRAPAPAMRAPGASPAPRGPPPARYATTAAAMPAAGPPPMPPVPASMPGPSPAPVAIPTPASGATAAPVVPAAPVAIPTPPPARPLVSYVTATSTGTFEIQELGPERASGPTAPGARTLPAMPVVLPAALSGSAPPGAAPVVARPPRPRAPAILVVDDEMFFREMYTDLLRAQGYEVRTAADGREALEVMRQHRPDLVILDAMLPGIHGFDICRQIKQSRQYGTIPVIMVTGLYKGWRYGADIKAIYGAEEVMEKPIKEQVLYRRIGELLAERGETPPPPPPAAEQSGQEVNAAIQAGVAAMQAGNLEEALAMFRHGLDADPFSATLHFYVGNVHLRTGSTYDAMNEYERAVDLDPQLFAAAKNLAILYERQGFRHKAFEVWERALKACADEATRARIEQRLRNYLDQAAPPPGQIT